mgnify:CR=1 FL=1
MSQQEILGHGGRGGLKAGPFRPTRMAVGSYEWARMLLR